MPPKGVRGRGGRGANRKRLNETGRKGPIDNTNIYSSMQCFVENKKKVSVQKKLQFVSEAVEPTLEPPTTVVMGNAKEATLKRSHLHESASGDNTDSEYDGARYGVKKSKLKNKNKQNIFAASAMAVSGDETSEDERSSNPSDTEVVYGVAKHVNRVVTLQAATEMDTEQEQEEQITENDNVLTHIEKGKLAFTNLFGHSQSQRDIQRHDRVVVRDNNKSSQLSAIKLARETLASQKGKTNPNRVHTTPKPKKSELNSTHSNRSHVWTFFQVLDDGRKLCKVCAKQYGPKTANSALIQHISKNHTKEPEIEIPDEAVVAKRKVSTVSTPLSSISPIANDNTVYASCNDSVIPSSPSPYVLGKKPSQSKLPTYMGVIPKPKDFIRGTPDCNQMDMLISNLVSQDCLPYIIFQSKSLQKCFNYLDPTYKMPCIQYMQNKILPVVYAKGELTLRSILEEQSAISICIDMWTSKAMQSYITFNVTFIDQNFSLQGAVLSTKRITGGHTSENLSIYIRAFLEKWDLTQKDIYFVTDNASDITKACKDIGHNWMGCTAHILNLVVKDGLNEENVLKLNASCKAIVKFIKKSVPANETLDNQCNCHGVAQLRLIASMTIRWNTVHDMLERLDLLINPVNATLVLHDKTDLVLTTLDQVALKAVIKVLAPFKIMTELLSGEVYPTASLNKHAILFAKEKTLPCDDDPQMILNMKTRMHANVSMRHSSADAVKTLDISSCIDPRFRNHTYNEKAHDTVMDAAVVIYNESHPPPIEHSGQQIDDDIIPGTLGQNIQQISDFEHCYRVQQNQMGPGWFNLADVMTEEDDTTSVQDIVKAEWIKFRKLEINHQIGKNDFNPIEWWKDNKQTFPLLAEVARKYLAIPATSVAAERTFSLAGNIINNKRTKLLPENVDQIIFLHSNSKFLPETFNP